MTDQCKCRRALTAAFEEAALALGGVVASYPIPDEAVWELSRVLDLIHARACARFGQCSEGGAPAADDLEDEQHPALIHLLRRLNERPAAAGTCGGACRGGVVR